MIKQIKWGSRNSKEPPSPFSTGYPTRQIRIVLHSSSFDGAHKEHLLAIQLLRDLAKLKALEVIDTEPGALPYLNIEEHNRNGSTIPISVREGQNWKIKSGIRNPEHLFKAFISCANKSSSEDLDHRAGYRDFLVARATDELSYDVLVSLSHYLITNQENPIFRVVNLRSPLEAVKIIGLLLRTRGGYIFEAGPSYYLTLDRRSIYKELLCHELPTISAYIKASAHAESFGTEGITYLAQSALIRCTRALQARDEIGVLFYMPQSDNSRDSIMYHFDYLALLLAGALDAQARVARRVYGINQPDEVNTGFHRKNFLEALKRSSAIDLYNAVCDEHFCNLTTLLREIRNSIHGSVWPTIAQESDTNPQESFIKVPPPYQDKIWQAALRISSADKWGLIPLGDVSMLLLEPYSYAVSLVAECFRQIDQIARLTEVTRLLPADFDMTQLQNKAPSNKDDFVRQRVALLD
jgi:hypothetical protein